MTWRYNRGTLSPTYRQVYDMIREGVSSFDDDIAIDPVDPGILLDLYTGVRFDDPFLFHVTGTIGYRMVGGMAVSISPEYAMDESRYGLLRRTMQEKVDCMAEPLLDIADPFLREESICRTIHRGVRWVKHEGGSNNLSEYLHDHTALGPLLYGSGTCEGLAFAFSALADACGIDAGIVHNESHAWNVVRLDGVVSHLDAGTVDFTSPMFMMNCFNISDDEILYHHDGAPRVGAVNNDMFAHTGRFANDVSSLKGVLHRNRDMLESRDGLSIRVWTDNLDELVPVLKAFKRDTELDIHADIRGRILILNVR